MFQAGTYTLKFSTIFGVDFSGAKEAGRNIWLARCEPVSVARNGRATRSKHPSLRLTDLTCLESLCGIADRAPVLSHLVDLIKSSRRCLWSMDFPFGFPIEVFSPGTRWRAQIDFLREWGDDAYGVGLECLRRAKRLGGPMHIRRQTDDEMKAPFDCYHYRIIYQAFYGMRDVLRPLSRSRGTAILPFQYRRLRRADRVLVETCPSSTLKRLSLPHQNYKQPAGGPLTPKRRRTRRAILEGLAQYVTIEAPHHRCIMRNGGGDALDAVIAAVGSHLTWQTVEHRSIARHARYPLAATSAGFPGSAQRCRWRCLESSGSGSATHGEECRTPSPGSTGWQP